MLLTNENYQKIKQIIGQDVKHKQVDESVLFQISDFFNAIIRSGNANDFEVSLILKSYGQCEDKYIACLNYLDASKPKKDRVVTLAQCVGESADKALNNLFGEQIITTDLKFFDKILGNQTQSLSLGADQDGGVFGVLFIPSFRDVDHVTSGNIDVDAGRNDFEVENSHIQQVFEQFKNECKKFKFNSLNEWGKKGRPYHSMYGVDISPR